MIKMFHALFDGTWYICYSCDCRIIGGGYCEMYVSVSGFLTLSCHDLVDAMCVPVDVQLVLQPPVISSCLKSMTL